MTPFVLITLAVALPWLISLYAGFVLFEKSIEHCSHQPWLTVYAISALLAVISAVALLGTSSEHAQTLQQWLLDIGPSADAAWLLLTIRLALLACFSASITLWLQYTWLVKLRFNTIKLLVHSRNTRLRLWRLVWWPHTMRATLSTLLLLMLVGASLLCLWTLPLIAVAIAFLIYRCIDNDYAPWPVR